MMRHLTVSGLKALLDKCCSDDEDDEGQYYNTAATKLPRKDLEKKVESILSENPEAIHRLEYRESFFKTKYQSKYRLLLRKVTRNQTRRTSRYTPIKNYNTTPLLPPPSITTGSISGLSNLFSDETVIEYTAPTNRNPSENEDSDVWEPTDTPDTSHCTTPTDQITTRLQSKKLKGTSEMALNQLVVHSEIGESSPITKSEFEVNSDPLDQDIQYRLLSNSLLNQAMYQPPANQQFKSIECQSRDYVYNQESMTMRGMPDELVLSLLPEEDPQGSQIIPTALQIDPFEPTMMTQSVRDQDETIDLPQLQLSDWGIEGLMDCHNSFLSNIWAGHSLDIPPDPTHMNWS